MGRRAAIAVLLAGLLAPEAGAGQASSSFQVGITIGGAAAKKSAVVAKPARRYTWGAAAISVRQAGFEAPSPAERSDTVYWFIARKNGSTFRVAVSRYSGAILKVIPA